MNPTRLHTLPAYCLESVTRRLLGSIIVSPEACWLTRFSLDRKGYPRFGMATSFGEWKQTSAHRAMWLLAKGDIPDGLVVDHLCRNRACVNPSHLEAVTSRENILRGATPTRSAYHHERKAHPDRSRTTHCRRGHERSTETVLKRARADGYEAWECLPCKKIKAAEYRATRRLADCHVPRRCSRKCAH